MKKQISDALSEEAKGDAYGMTEQDEELLNEIAKKLLAHDDSRGYGAETTVGIHYPSWEELSGITKEEYREDAREILAKAKPIIEKQEREKIGTDLEDLIYSAELDMKVEDVAVIFGLVGVLKSGKPL